MSKKSTGKENFALAKENYILLVIGFAIIVLGFILMIGGKSVVRINKKSLTFR